MSIWEESADIVFKNGIIFNPFTCEWLKEDFAVKSGIVIGTGFGYQGKKEIDLKSSYIVPGFIDAHVHIESSLLTPYEYARLVMQHGTTTVIADPHEIANVWGIKGIEYMLQAHEDQPLDILVMLPSCVPATPIDECAMTLNADLLRPFIGRNGVLGLGEMMNVPGVLSHDPPVIEKLTLTSIRDGHAPFLTGTRLDEYIVSGLQSDHETTALCEGKEKLQKSMFLLIREGSTERNLQTLIPLVNACTSPRCSFCTDDRHVDMLVTSGHIDDCVRKAIAEGCEPEYAYRMATLSPAERFRLFDRGALSPGRLADFCVLDNMRDCSVRATFKKGYLVKPDQFRPDSQSLSRDWPFVAKIPTMEDIRITGSGIARVIHIQEGQIGTKTEYLEVSSENIPDINRDILKVVVVSRYHPGRSGVGLVQGMKLHHGALAVSISHDSHNIIAVGTCDDDIISSIASVVQNKGAMVAHYQDKEVCLPLSLAGLMSELTFEEVHKSLSELHELTDECGAIENPFMYLSFLTLSVIPEIRITTKGVFDVNRFSHVPLFVEGKKS
ncbi:MAG: adenine deaminase [Methanomicrobiales archaeon]|nr:adenine deaminase [Methanomicrobiales archaeon]